MTTTTLLVRRGADERLRPDQETGEAQHTLPNVYKEMLLQVCRDYPGIPDPRTLTMTEIRFFYEGVREELKKHTAPKRPTAPSSPRRPARRRK